MRMNDALWLSRAPASVYDKQWIARFDGFGRFDSSGILIVVLIMIILNPRRR